ncbi:MAG: hypothetical protein WA667_29790 [Candidatus Nitrosopolaris sp.]
MGVSSEYYPSRSRVNSDGGWGTRKDEPSNIESTALSLIALASVRENKFVPSRLVDAVLEAAHPENTQLKTKLNKLNEDIAQRVQERIRNIIDERNDLSNKLQVNR